MGALPLRRTAYPALAGRQGQKPLPLPMQGVARDGYVKDYSTQASAFLLDIPITLNERLSVSPLSAGILDNARRSATSCEDKVQVMG